MRQILEHNFRYTTLQLGCFVCFLLGIGLARTHYSIPTLWLVLLGFGACFGWWQRKIGGLVIIVIFSLCLGLWRGSSFMTKLAEYDGYYNHSESWTMRAAQDAVYGARSQLTFDGIDMQAADGRHLAGTVSVSGFGTNAVFAGDSVEAFGKLRSGYGSKQASLSFAKLVVRSHHNSLITEIRRRFTSSIQTALPEPLASFAMGLLIGQRATLPKSVKQDLLMVGLTHIIAVSGYNLTIMLHASKKLLAQQSKRLATLLSFGLIIGFLLLAGSSASIIRAAIVSTLSITTAYYGRSMKPLQLITLAAAITAWANPFYVWSDISWYLSFLAFFGVMLVAPLIAERLPFKHKDNVLIAIGMESIGAELMSLPIILFTFGQMSFVGLVGNILVVGLVPLAMLLSAVTGVVGMTLPWLVGWIAWPAKIVLNYMLDVSHLLAKVPHIFVENLSLSLPEMLMWYLGIGLFVAALWYKSQSGSGIITDIQDEN